MRTESLGAPSHAPGKRFLDARDRRSQTASEAVLLPCRDCKPALRPRKTAGYSSNHEKSRLAWECVVGLGGLEPATRRLSVPAGKFRIRRARDGRRKDWHSAANRAVAGLWACYYYRYSSLERKSARSERDAKQEASILSGLPIDPKHANPKLKGWRISDSLRHFFADFGRFGVIANEWPPIKDSSWRLQELKDTKLRTFNNDVPKQGRRYDVFYNRQRVGSLEIADTSDYTIEEPRVIANLVIRDPRPKGPSRSYSWGRLRPISN